MNFPIIIEDGNALITFTGKNERSVTAPEAHDQFGNVIHSSLEDMMIRIESGRAKIVFTADSPIIVIRPLDFGGRLFRVRGGQVECSITEGRTWMSSNASVCWFIATMRICGKAYAPLDEFIG